MSIKANDWLQINDLIRTAKLKQKVKRKALELEEDAYYDTLGEFVEKHPIHSPVEWSLRPDHENPVR